MALLEETRTKDTFLQRYETMSLSLKKIVKASLNHFNDFCVLQYKEDAEKIIEELGAINSENQIFDVLQRFSNYLYKKGIRSVRMYLKPIKTYITYKTNVKIHTEDLRENIKLPKRDKRKNYSLAVEDIRKLLDYATPKRKAYYLILLGSGLRPREGMQLRKRDFTKGERYRINIPARYTKTRQERHTYLTKEAEKYILPILEKIKDDDLVFTKNDNPYHAYCCEASYFDRLRKKAGFTSKYDTGVNPISLHTFRSWFITKCSKIDMGLGHALSGHEHYMKQYERYEEKDMIDFFVKAEQALSIFETAVEDREELLKKIANLEAKAEEHDKLLRDLAEADRITDMKHG